MFKKKKERKHLVPWIHRKHKHKDQGHSQESTDQALQDKLSLKVPSILCRVSMR